jgi:hypothetical protein
MTITFAFNVSIASAYPFASKKTMKILVEMMVVLFALTVILKPVELEVPQAVLQILFFEAIIKFLTIHKLNKF